MNKQKWIDHALANGFESFEIYRSVSEEKTLKYYEGTMESFVTSHVLGTSLRGLYNGKMATISTEDPGDGQLEELVETMKEQSLVIDAKENGDILAPETTEEVSGKREWKDASSAKLLSLMKEIEEKCLAYDPRIFQVTDMEYTKDTSRREITNSLGLNISEEEEYAILFAGAAAKEGDDIRNDYKIEVLEDPEHIDTDRFVKELCEEVLGKLGSSSLPSGTYPVILRYDAMTSLFSAFSSMFSGELIGKGISPLKDKLNEKIFSEKITVIDDPKNTDALSIANYDDEGHPTYRKTVVDQGTFVLALQDTRSAKRMNTVSTGNGFKGSYASAVAVSPLNMNILKGDKSLKELEEQMKDGLVITDFQGLHAGIDFVTTNFSLQCSGYLVKDGKKEHSVSLITAAGNFLDLMKKVEEVGNDGEWSYHRIVAPSILFSGIAVSGE